MNKNKIIKLSVSKFIDTGFRNYALYVLTSRGIPGFEDGLTPVQRYIIDNSPTSFTKTLSVVGKCIEAGYHHGNQAIEKSLARLARPFGSALQILEGYGFFGSEVSPDAASARYTSVKLSNKAGDIIRKYKYLFTKDHDGVNEPFWLDVPIGLTNPIVGIAVGYKSIVLPRKLEDIQNFLIGKKKTLKPYFNNFNGNIEKYNSNKSWLISSKINVKDNCIEIRELPPVMKYSSILSKLDWLFTKYENNIKVINNSNTKVNIDIVYLGKDKTDFENIKTYIQKVFSIIVNENLVFIKDNQVLVYDTIEDYLEDYKWHLLKLDFKNNQYKKDLTSDELEFNKAKKVFIEFILTKKRTIAEIDEFLKNYNNVKDRLESMTAKKFTKDEVLNTDNKIKELTKELKEIQKLFKASEIKLSSIVDPTLVKGISSKKSAQNLFDFNDLKDDNGIEVWDGGDNFEDEIKEDDNEK